jgi:ATP-dependent DNA helicase DinG
MTTETLQINPLPNSLPPTTSDIMSFFPLETARRDQEMVIREIDSAFKAGNKIVILEAPVGSGKSAIAATLALAQGTAGAHLITPRKSLQDQYFDDFTDHLVLMKGRNAYPCTQDAPTKDYNKVIKLITEGRIGQPGKDEQSCSDAPCRDSSVVFKYCTQDRPCPYNVAIEIAQNQNVVVHNMHSFIFQSSFGGKFEKRGLLVVDEAHEIESTIRDFITKKVYLPLVFKEGEFDNFTGWGQWETFLLKDTHVPQETARDVSAKRASKTYKSERDKYLERVAMLNHNQQLEKGFAVEIKTESRFGTSLPQGTTFEFIPQNVGPAVNSMLIDFGEKVLLMSGTIYNKEAYCKYIGIDPSSAYFIRIGSSFPKENRPLYCIPEYQVNTSHASWSENFSDMIEKIKKISSVFHDVKGLIHAPSYMAAEQIRNALNDPRYVSHQPFDFQEKLSQFFSTPGNGIFISPVCQQGVDFKGDRANFQIITRVPYLNTSSKFVQDKVKNNFPWYNYQSLVVFGQQIGRVNRSPEDFGATFLLDERFSKYLSKNSKMLPGWVKEAIVWKSSTNKS